MIDVWSLGILLFELCHGRAPFTGNQVKIHQEIVKGELRFNKGLSNDYKDLVHLLLQQNSDMRLPLIRIFVHPWVMKFQKKYNITRCDTQSDDSDCEDSDE